LPDYRYTVTEHDPERPWIVRGTSHGTVTLDENANFSNWAAEHWPAPRWTSRSIQGSSRRGCGDAGCR